MGAGWAATGSLVGGSWIGMEVGLRSARTIVDLHRGPLGFGATTEAAIVGGAMGGSVGGTAGVIVGAVCANSIIPPHSWKRKAH